MSKSKGRSWALLMLYAMTSFERVRVTFCVNSAIREPSHYVFFMDIAKA